jgi:hypothetical protein
VNDDDGKWTASKWLTSLGLHAVVATALSLPESLDAQYEYVASLTPMRIAQLLTDAKLEGVRARTHARHWQRTRALPAPAAARAAPTMRRAQGGVLMSPARSSPSDALVS